jgi:O-antigen/teichoic acid export membrane protein
VLARWLTPEPYGVLRVAMTVLVWVEITVNNGVPAALQKFLPDASLSEQAVRHAAARVQTLIGVGVFAAVFLAAPLLARLLGDPELSAVLRLAFVDLLGMSAYAYYRGVLNGKRAFRQLATAIAAYALTKLVFSSVLVMLGLGVEGALLGNIASSLGAFAVAWLLARRWRRTPAAPAAAGVVSDRQILLFVLPAIGLTLASNLMLQMDLIGVQVLVDDAAQVGYYGAAAQLADAPRLVLLAFSFTLLPALSHAIAARDPVQTRRTLRQVVRLLALAILPIVALVTATSQGLVTFLFSAAYAPAAPYLTVLIFTYAAYSVYITLMTTLLAENRPGLAFAIPCVLLPVGAVAIWVAVGRIGALGAALASLAVVGSAALIVIGYVWSRYRPQIDLMSLLRVALASAVVWAVARLWSPAGLMVPVNYGLLGALYVGMLLILGEVHMQDLAVARRWLSFSKASRR